MAEYAFVQETAFSAEEVVWVSGRRWTCAVCTSLVALRVCLRAMEPNTPLESHRSERRFDSDVTRASALEHSECPQWVADSTGQRNRLAEHFSRRLEAESLARPLVQLSRHGVELGL